MKILQWNLENFFLNLDKYDRKTPLLELSETDWQRLSIAREPNKPLAKLLEIRDIFRRLQPDIAILSEVGTPSSLHNFVKYFLPEYQVQMLPGRSRRGIDCGFLVRGGTEFTYEVQNLPTVSLSRTAAKLNVYRQKKLVALVLGVHLKAKTALGQDWFSLEQRAAEFQELTQMVQDLRQQSPEVALFLGGDFNGESQGEYACHSFVDFLSTVNLTDLHRLRQSSVEERCTFVRTEPAQLNQLDYILFPREQANLIDVAKSESYRFRTYYDLPLPFPENILGKRKLPSDHYPTLLTVKL